MYLQPFTFGCDLRSGTVPSSETEKAGKLVITTEQQRLWQKWQTLQVGVLLRIYAHEQHRHAQRTAGSWGMQALTQPGLVCILHCVSQIKYEQLSPCALCRGQGCPQVAVRRLNV